MTFQESVKICFSKYADFNGRATRSEFWWFILAVFIGGIVAAFLGHMINTVFSLAVLIPELAVGARRLHDTNRSGWWQLLCLIPIIGWIILIIFYAQPGQTEENQFGTAPAITAT